MAFLAPAVAALTSASTLVPLAIGAGAGLLMSKASVPAVPSITIPPAPDVPNAPLAPQSLSDTAAIQRARAQRAILTGASKTILTSPSSRDDTNLGVIAGSASKTGPVQRTTLLGA
jgi:hypothetical protein